MVSAVSFMEGIFIGVFTRLQDACEDPSPTLMKCLGYRRSGVGLACSSHLVTTNGGDYENVYSLRSVHCELVVYHQLEIHNLIHRKTLNKINSSKYKNLIKKLR